MDLSDYINNLEKKAAEQVTVNEVDYIGEDGLLYCGVCRTKKQTRIIFLGEERTPYCICRCHIKKREAEEQKRKELEFSKKVTNLRNAAFPDSIMRSWSFDNDDGSNKRIIDAAHKYVDNFDEMRKNGKGLLLFGPVGTGKTYAAACIANALVDKGYSVLMTNFTRIANTAFGMYEGKQRYYDDLNKYSLLVLDDLCAERKTEAMQETVYHVIDARYRSGLPLIVTTNLTERQLKYPNDMCYQRIFSRLYEMCLPIEVTTDDDKRIDKLELFASSMREQLGL